MRGRSGRPRKWFGASKPGAKHLPLERVIGYALGENPFPSHRIREALGWVPKHEHGDALRRTGEWLKSS